MGFYDTLFDPQQGLLTNQQSIGTLGLIGSLLTARKGADLGQPFMQYALLKQKADADERANRANDLQQLKGLRDLLQQNEALRMLQAKRTGQEFVPNPAIGQLDTRMMDLSSPGNMRGIGGVNPPAPSTFAPAAPSVPASVASQYSLAVKPELKPDAPMPQPQKTPTTPLDVEGFGNPAGGVPAEIWLSQPNGMATYLKQLAEDNKAMSTRYGIYTPKRDAQGNISSYGLAGGALPPNALPVQMGPNGPKVEAYPGQPETAAQMAGASAAGTAFGRLPYETPTAVNTKGAPTLMTPSQQITAATGQPPPNPFVATVPPQVQAQRNSQQLQILQAELAKETDPTNRAMIMKEISALSGAQSRNQPFTSQQPPGLTLQDQSSTAAQKEFGQGVGKQATDTLVQGAQSVQAKRALAGMSDMARSYTPGVFQPLKSKLVQYAAGIGLPEDAMNKILSTNAGDIQGLTSAAIAMAGRLTRQTDAQPSQLQFLKTLESMPSAERSGQGFAKIMDYLNSLHDYNIEKMIAQQQWLSDPKNAGDPSGFEAAWAAKSKDLPFVWNSQQPKPRANVDDLVKRYRTQ